MTRQEYLRVSGLSIAKEFLAKNFTIPDESRSIMSGVLRELRYTEIIERYQTSVDETTVTFCGGFNTGKSTLINRLLDVDILPTRFTTATSVVTRIEYGEHQEAFVERYGERRTVSMDIARQMILYDEEQDFDENGVIRVSYKFPHPLLQNGVVLIDTPGIDDHERLTEVSIAQARKSSLCVVVFTAEQFNKLSDKRLCTLLNEAAGGNLVFVVNKCDVINSPAEFDNLLRFQKSALRDFGNELIGKGKVFNTSCLDGSANGLDGFDAWLDETLCQHAFKLHETSGNARTKILVRELLEALDSEVAELDAITQSRREDSMKAAETTFRRARTKITALRGKLAKFQIEQIERLRSAAGYAAQTLESYKTAFNAAMMCEKNMTVSNTFEWKKDAFLSMLFPAFFENLQDEFEETFSADRLYEGLPDRLQLPPLPDKDALVREGEIPRADADTTSHGYLFGKITYFVGSCDKINAFVTSQLIPRSEQILRGMFQKLEERIKAFEAATSLEKLTVSNGTELSASTLARLDALKRTRQTVQTMLS